MKYRLQRPPVAFVLTILTCAVTAHAQSHPPAIASISICSPSGRGGAGSCPAGTFDTQQIVLATNGSGLNHAINGGVSDEHQSVFAPGTLNQNPDYLFFVATRTSANSDTGLAVLSGGAGPDSNGQWTLDFATADRYGTYPSGVGQVFLSAVGRSCPTVTDGDPAHQDPTFDLNYAAPGSVVIDPTDKPGHLLMIYEGTITCFGTTGGPRSDNFYSTVGIATSADYGRTWPVYRGTSAFNFVPLPGQNTTQGPHQPFGATGAGVCAGTDCSTTPPASYGRYAVLTPAVSVASVMATGKPLSDSMGDAEMSGFVDDAGGPAQYVYAVYSYSPGSGSIVDPTEPNRDLMLARARLNGGTAPLAFNKWDGQAFESPGIAGHDRGILPSGAFQNCAASGQLRTGASIDFVDETQQYLLTFVCESPGDPASGVSGGNRGAAWFYSTSYDLSNPNQWTPPHEIEGSWSVFDTSGGCSNYTGWYPSFMSLDRRPGHLGMTGYAFYLWGCQTANTPPPGRQYSSRAFTIKVNVPARRRTAQH